MPIGAFKINGIAKRFAVAVSAEVIRRKVNIAANGNAQVSTAQSQFGGSSAVFDGTGDFLRIYNPGTLAFDSNDFTIECWVRPTGTKKDFPLIIHNYIDGTFDATGSWFLADRHNSASTKFSFWVDNFNGQASPMLTSTTSVSTNTWYHIAIVRSGTTFRMFVNGTQEATATFSGSFDSNLSNNWGVGDWNSGTVNGYIGNIDEIRVSNSARYTTNFTAPTQPFVNDDNTRLLIHANGTNASTFFEDDNGVTALRQPKYITAAGNAQVSTAQSVFGGSSALFDGTGDYLVVDNSSTNFTFGTTDFTIEMRVRFTSTKDFQILYDGRVTSAFSSITPVFYIQNGNQLHYFVNGVDIFTASVTTNTWYHVAVSRSGTSTKMFLNGTQVGSTYTDSNNYICDSTLWLGGHRAVGGSNAFSLVGNMDEVRVSNSARYTANFTSPTAKFANDTNTLLLLHMDGGTGSTGFFDDVGGRTQKSLRLAGNAQVSTAQSKFGGASALFDGSGDYLDIPNINNEFTFGNSEFTIEFWIRFNSTNFGFVYDQRPSGTNGYFPNLSWFSSAVRYYVNGSDRIVSNTLSTGVWYHVAIVKTGNDTKMYINGTQQGSTWTDSNILGSGAQILFAAETFSYGTNALNAYYDEIRISKSARYTANFTAPTEPFINDANTLLLSHMDGTNASTVFRDDNGAVANRQPKYITAFGNAQVSTAQSQFGGSSALFDGTGDYLKVLDNNDFKFTGNFTIEGWFRITTFQSFNNLITNWGAAGTRWYLSLWSANSLYFYANGGEIVGATGLTFSTNTWYHIAVSRNGSSVRLFVNGTQVGSTATYSAEITTGTSDVVVCGLNDGTQNWPGYADEIRISNIARYTANFTPSTTQFVNDANTLLLLHFKGRTGSTAFLDDTGSRLQKGIYTAGNAQISTAQSKFGGSSYLGDGTGDFIYVDGRRDLEFGLGDFTIEMWVRFNNTTAAIFYDSRDFNINTSVSPTIYWTSSTIRFYTNAADRITSGTLSTGTWYHVAVSRSGTSTKMFINGTQAGSTYTDTNFYLNGINNERPLIGADNNGASSLNGNIDEIRISNIARYTANFTEPTQPFVNDANTLLLLHMDGTNASNVFVDDNGVIPYTPT